MVALSSQLKSSAVQLKQTINNVQLHSLLLQQYMLLSRSLCFAFKDIRTNRVTNSHLQSVVHLLPSHMTSFNTESCWRQKMPCPFFEVPMRRLVGYMFIPPILPRSSSRWIYLFIYSPHNNLVKYRRFRMTISRSSATLHGSMMIWINSMWLIHQWDAVA